MGADVADCAKLTAPVGLQSPVPVGLEEEPVLEVAAGHQPDVAECVIGDDLARVLVQRVEADVEVHGADPAGSLGKPHELTRLLRGQGQRLLADDVAPGGEDLAHLRMVKVVR
jgi:hypothetical protein